jgi:hypothetical protein
MKRRGPPWRAAFFLLLGAAAACSSVRLAINKNADLAAVRRIAVVPFADSAAQSRVTGEWQTLLLSLGYQVVERGSVDLLLRENGLSISGAVDPSEASKISRILGVDGLVIGQPGLPPRISYDRAGDYQLSEPPPVSVKLVDIKTARILWQVFFPQAQDSAGNDATPLMFGHENAVTASLRRKLRSMLLGANWSFFPAPSNMYYHAPSALLPGESGLTIAFSPSLDQSTRIRVGVYPFKTSDLSQADVWADQMSDALLSAGYDVIDRAQLGQILKEQKFSLTGAVRPEDMAKLGKIAGIQALAFGTVEIMQLPDKAAPPLCAYAARLANVGTGELYWSLYGRGCRLSRLAGALSESLAKIGGATHGQEAQ